MYYTQRYRQTGEGGMEKMNQIYSKNISYL